MGVRFESTGISDKEEVINILKKRGFFVYEWEDSPGTYYPTHIHTYREVRWVIEGEVVIGTEEKEFLLSPGDMIELEPVTPHWAKSEKGVKYICGSKEDG